VNPNPFLGLLYHWTGGLSAASCYLPFRGIRRWSWETYWILQGCFSWIVAPLVFAGLLIPELGGILRGASTPTLFYAWFWGAMWGIGGLLFGLGVRYLGIALGYTIALGFSTACGTLVPPLFAGQLGGVARDPAGRVVLLGVGVSLVAIAVSGFAGRMKERELAGGSAEDAVSPSGRGEYLFGRGILVASFAGIMSACFNYGLTAAKPMNDATRGVLLAHGHSDVLQSLPALIVVLLGGFTTNVLWCGGLLVKNRSAAQFVGAAADGGKCVGARQMTLNYVFACAAGLLWYLQFFFYSMGQTKMGRYDFSSWTLHMAGTILFATLWGAILHEWRGTSARTKRVGALGLGLLLLSTLVVGYGNYLKAHAG
jgi:L-rhamnose-H+ transport protein